MSSTLRQLLPHYLAMFVIYLIGIFVVGALLGQMNFWISVFVAIVIALGYPPAIRRLDMAPDVWDR
jgi:hypothetical protein